jgi:hypothetical protein
LGGFDSELQARMIHPSQVIAGFGRKNAGLAACSILLAKPVRELAKSFGNAKTIGFAL